MTRQQVAYAQGDTKLWAAERERFEAAFRWVAEGHYFSPPEPKAGIWEVDLAWAIWQVHATLRPGEVPRD